MCYLMPSTVFDAGSVQPNPLSEFSHDIFQALHEGDQIDAILIDFSKAFDTVSHYKLFNKLTVTLKNKALVKWISSFFQFNIGLITYPPDPLIAPLAL